MPVAGNDPESGALRDANSSAELGPLSPELALIDPDLARAARALLPDVQPTRLNSQSTSLWVAELPAVNIDAGGSIESTADLGPSRPRPQLGRLYWILGLTVLGVALTLLVRSEWPLLREQSETAQPATSPRTSTSPATPTATTPQPATTAITPAVTTPRPAVKAKAPSLDGNSANGHRKVARTRHDRRARPLHEDPATGHEGAQDHDTHAYAAATHAPGRLRPDVRLGRFTESVGLRVPALPGHGASVPSTRD